MKGNSYFSKILALLCVVAMVVTMMPLGLMRVTESYAVDETASETSVTENSEEGTGAEETKPAQEEAGTETVSQEPEAKTNEASDNETVGKAADPKKEESQPAGNSDKKAEEKVTDKKDEAKVFKAEFDFGDNYAKFSPINPKTTDPDGVITLPEKPEAMKKVYEARDGRQYYFTGWKYKDDEYEPGDEVTLKADAKFTAVWKQVYTIKFSAKGIKADKVEDQIAVYGEPVVLPDETASKDGMDFVGWTPDKGKTVYKAETKIKAEKIEPAFATAKNSVVKLSGDIEDTTPPQIKIVAPSNPSTEGKADINISATDASDVDTLQYFVSDSDVTDYSEISAWEDVPSGSIKVDDGKYLVVKAEDKSDNKNTAYKKRKINLEEIKGSNAPALTITTTAEEAGAAAKSHDVSFKNTGSEIDTIDVYVGGDLISGLSGDGSTTSITVSEETTGKELNGNIEIKVSATGIWGGVSTASITCAFDNTAPSVSLTMDATHSYYKADNCGMKAVVASDDAADLASLSIKAKVGTSTEEIDLGTVTTATCSLTAAAVADKFGAIEGSVTITAVATDNAGNTGEASLDINYDAVAPKLVSATTFEESGSEAFNDNNYYHNSGAVTTYKVAENNLLTISLAYKWNGVERTGTPDVDNKKVTGSWNSEGTYSDIKVSAADKAGNKLVLGDSFTYSAEDEIAEVSEGVASFKYGKVVDTTKPTATITYYTGVSPRTNENAKIHIYKGEEVTEAYVSGTVSANVRVEDNLLLLCNIHWKKSDGTIDKLRTDDIYKSGSTYYAELTDVKVVDSDGTAAYQIYGYDLAGNTLQVTELTADGVEVESHGGASWPVEPKKARRSSDILQLNFTMDTVSPVYTSTFNEVEDASDNTAEKTGEYTAYYGNTTNVGGQISAGFEIVEANLDYDETWAKMVYKTGEDYSAITPAETDDPTTMTFAAQGDNKYSCQKTVSGQDGANNGVYRFYVYGIDKAGNPLVMSTAEGEKAAVTGNTGYNKTISCGSNEPGKFRSFSKVLDTEAPGYGLKISDDDMDGYLVKYGNLAEEKQDLGTDGIYEPFRKKKTATVLAKGYDKSPVKIQYRFKTFNQNSQSESWSIEPAEGEAPYSTAGYISSADEKTLTETKGEETQFRVKGLTVCDRAGNTTSLEESNTVYLDGSVPERGIDLIDPVVSIISATKAITRHDTGYELYNDSVTLTFRVKDPNKNKSSSGLQDVWYTASVEGEVIAEGDLIGPEDKELYFKDGYFLDLDKSEVAEAIKAKEAEGKDGDEALEYEIERTVTIPKGKTNGYESNDIVITLHAKDNSDNEAYTEKNLGIDSIDPVITVEYDNNDVRNEKYFKDKRIATVVVTDRNFGESSDKVKISTQGKVDSKWTYHKGDDKFGDEDTWTKKIVYDHDGDYTLKVRGTDALGNGPIDAKALNDKQKAPWAFTVDMTAPVIKVTFDNNSVRNKKYYKANRTATITIVEHNFYDPDVKTPGTAKAPRKKAMKFPGRTKFSSKGDTRRSTIDFNKEGNYTFDVTYTDLAGNPAKTVKVPEFVIDKTPPVVKIENVDANGIYSGAVAPRASFDDDNFDRNNSKFSFTGAKGGDRSDLAGGMKENEYGGVYTMSDFARIRKNDDIYTASATSTDMAGNTTTVTLSFSVNRFGSTYDYDGDTATVNLVSKKSGRYYTNKPQALVLREINVNPLKKYALILYKDDTSRKLEKGVDYRAEQRRGKGGYETIYYINEDVIYEEGSYNIVATSEDEAGNMNTNASVRNEDGVNEVPLKFVYDTTLPTVSFLDLSDGSKTITLKEKGSTLFRGMTSLDLGVRPDDEWALSAIEIGIRSSNPKKGQLFGPTKYEGEEFWEYMGEDKQKYFEEIINSGSDTKYIDLTVWDAAGNESKMTYEVIVTANIFELMLHYWYIVLAILLAIAAGVVLFTRRNRNREEEQAG